MRPNIDLLELRSEELEPVDESCELEHCGRVVHIQGIGERLELPDRPRTSDGPPVGDGLGPTQVPRGLDIAVVLGASFLL